MMLHQGFLEEMCIALSLPHPLRMILLIADGILLLSWINLLYLATNYSLCPSYIIRVSMAYTWSSNLYFSLKISPNSTMFHAWFKDLIPLTTTALIASKNYQWPISPSTNPPIPPRPWGVEAKIFQSGLDDYEGTISNKFPRKLSSDLIPFLGELLLPWRGKNPSGLQKG